MAVCTTTTDPEPKRVHDVMVTPQFGLWAKFLGLAGSTAVMVIVVVLVDSASAGVYLSMLYSGWMVFFWDEDEVGGWVYLNYLEWRGLGVWHDWTGVVRIGNWSYFSIIS